MPSLCEFCIKNKRKTCEGQEGWDANEQKFLAAYERLKKLLGENETDEEILKKFEETKQNMISRRVKGAQHYQEIATRRGCENLTILPFAQ